MAQGGGSASPRGLVASDERRLDAASDGKESMVSSMLVDNHQPDRRSGARDREGGCTAIEEIDNRRIPQDQRIEPAVILVALEGSELVVP